MPSRPSSSSMRDGHNLAGAEEITGQYELGKRILGSVVAGGSITDNAQVRLALLARTRALTQFVIGLSWYGARDYGNAYEAFEQADQPEWRDEDGKEILYLFLGNSSGKLKNYNARGCRLPGRARSGIRSSLGPCWAGRSRVLPGCGRRSGRRLRRRHRRCRGLAKSEAELRGCTRRQGPAGNLQRRGEGCVRARSGLRLPHAGRTRRRSRPRPPEFPRGHRRVRGRQRGPPGPGRRGLCRPCALGLPATEHEPRCALRGDQALRLGYRARHRQRRPTPDLLDQSSSRQQRTRRYRSGVYRRPLTSTRQLLAERLAQRNSPPKPLSLSHVCPSIVVRQ